LIFLKKAKQIVGGFGADAHDRISRTHEPQMTSLSLQTNEVSVTLFRENQSVPFVDIGECSLVLVPLEKFRCIAAFDTRNEPRFAIECRRPLDGSVGIKLVEARVL
jgi:hypothetical protein